MARDEQEGQRGLIQTLRNAAIRGTAAVMGVTVTHNCRHCGEVIVRGDSSPCGHHLPIPQGEAIHIGFVAPPDLLPEPPKVERLGRSSEERQVSNRYKDPTKIDPVREQPEQKEEEGPEPYWAEDPDFKPNAPTYRRKQENNTEWGMSSSEMNRRIDIAERGESDIPDPKNDDIPHCL
jgi:hypothetical protein